MGCWGNILWFVFGGCLSGLSWLLAGILSTSVVIYLMFNVQLQGWKFVVFFGVMYFAFSITYTMNDISYWGMVPALSSDADARNQSIQMGNLQGTLDLIDAIHEMKVGTFVGAGSLHEAESLVEMAEDKVISNMGYMYKASKMAAHWMGKAKAGSYGIRFFWPLINTYGEEERSARLVNTIIRKVLKGESPDLSAGTQYYDFVHVSDVAHALYLIAEKGIDGRNYVIGSGDAKPLKEFLLEVGKVANRMRGDDNEILLGFGKIKANVVSLPKETFDVRSLKEDTGFEPNVSFEEGIERTAEWIRENS